MALVIPEQLKGVKEPTQRVVDVLQPDFDFDINGRITTRADPNQFKYLADPGVYAQAREGANIIYEVYWDGVWVCDFNEQSSWEELKYIFLTGFTELYEKEEVAFNKPEYEERVDKHTEQIKRAKKMSETTPEEQLSKQAIVETLEEKKEDVDKRRKEVEDKH